MKSDFNTDFELGGAFELSPDATIWLVCAMVLSSVFFGAVRQLVLRPLLRNGLRNEEQLNHICETD